MNTIAQNIEMTGWAFAGFLCLINIVLVYLIVPAKKKINTVHDDFHQCQLKGIKSLSNLENQQQAFRNTTDRHNNIIEDIRDGMNKVEVKLSALEVVADNNSKLLQGMDEKIGQLLRNGNK